VTQAIIAAVERVRQNPSAWRAGVERGGDAAAGMRFFAVKSEAKQVSAVIFRTRDLLTGQRMRRLGPACGGCSK
jgi:hypothetical protein